MQAMTHGLSHWLPFHGLGATAIDDISLRSGMGACASFAINYRSESDRKKLQQHLSRYAAIRDIYAADFYPLTPWTVDPKQWLAFQFHDPEKVRGVVQVFRGKSDNGDSVMFRLNALEKDKVYNVQDWDEAVSRRMTGGELMNGGLKVTEATPEDIAKVWVYSEVD
jgi:alpha-galactosidase